MQFYLIYYIRIKYLLVSKLGSMKVENLFVPPTALLFEFVLYFLTRYWTDRSSIKTESIVQYFLEDIKVIKDM